MPVESTATAEVTAYRWVPGFAQGLVRDLRVGSPLLSHTLFGVYVGLLVWGGLWLCEPRLRALFPLKD